MNVVESEDNNDQTFFKEFHIFVFVHSYFNHILQVPIKAAKAGAAKALCCYGVMNMATKAGAATALCC